MKEEEFVDIFKKYSKKYDIEVEEENIHSFYSYMKNLMEWNSKINLRNAIYTKYYERHCRFYY